MTVDFATQVVNGHSKFVTCCNLDNVSSSIEGDGIIKLQPFMNHQTGIQQHGEFLLHSRQSLVLPAAACRSECKVGAYLIEL